MKVQKIAVVNGFSKFSISRKKLLAAAKEYKSSYEDGPFRTILNLIYSKSI